MGALPERNLTYPRLLFEKDPLAVSYCALAATLVSHPTPEIRYPAYKEMCHMADVAPPPRGHTSFEEQREKDSVRKVQGRISIEGHSLRCPYCEVSELEATGHNAARCPSCRAVLSGPVLGTLIWITQLPDALGRHACECGHPEMRCLPDGVYRCPACASEVTPVSRSS